MYESPPCRCATGSCLDHICILVQQLACAAQQKPTLSPTPPPTHTQTHTDNTLAPQGALTATFAARHMPELLHSALVGRLHASLSQPSE